MSNAALAIILTLVLCFTTFIVGLGVGISIGENQGRVSVASGQYVCVLEQKPDKTTEWVCKYHKERQ